MGMSKIEVERAIMNLNCENLNLKTSKEYIIGNRVCKYLDAIKKFDFITLFKLARKRRLNKLAGKRFTDKRLSNEHVEVAVPVEFCDEDMSATVTVYSCIIGNYDVPKPPLINYPNYRYVLFTDQTIDDDLGWEVYDLPQIDGLKKNDISINRYLKFHPDEFFDTDYSLYIDGNIRLLTGISDFTKCLNGSIGLAMFNHPERNCIYREAETCIYLGKGTKDCIQKQIFDYKSKGFPENFGLKEATVILSDLHKPEGLEILHDWWDEFNMSGSRRDQLSLPYVLWKRGLDIGSIGTLGENIRNDLHLQVHYHNKRN